MLQPWDRPELVREGDSNPDILYAAVGRLLSQWEGVEIQLGYIYAAAAEQHGDWHALHDYPDQAAEGTTKAVVDSATLFAARRHDVAHGIVRDRSWARWRIPPDPRDTTGFFLLPSHYRGKSYDHETAFPTYAYTAGSLEKLRNQLVQLETAAMGVAARLNRVAGGSTR
jgi:hypothetical protein